MRFLLDTQAVVWYVDQDHSAQRRRSCDHDRSHQRVTPERRDRLGDFHQGEHRKAVAQPALARLDDQSHCRSQPVSPSDNSHLRRRPDFTTLAPSRSL